MKKAFYSLLLFLAATVASCEKEPVITDPVVKIEAQDSIRDGKVSMPQFDTLRLKAAIDLPSHYSATWSVNGKERSKEPEFAFVASDLGSALITLDVLTSDGGKGRAEVTVEVSGRYKHGTFILNEGNMTTGGGSLVYVSPKGEVIDSAYWRANGSSPGNVTQDLFIAGGKLLVISQNGGGDGMLVIADAATLKKEAGFSKQQMSPLSWPTHVAAIKENIYIRDNKGVYRFNASTRELKFVEGSGRANKNRMAVADGKLFVGAGKNLYVIQGDVVTDTVTMGGTISGVIRSNDHHLWVSCTTSPATISKLKPSDLSVVRTNELGGGAQVGAGRGATPGITAKGDTLYFSNGSTKIWRHLFSSNQTEAITDVKDHLADAGMAYNGPAVHPLTGEVWFNTIKGYGMDYLINDIAVFKFSGATPQLKNDYKNHTAFPAGIFFTYDFE